jgi:hypothetical protein
MESHAQGLGRLEYTALGGLETSQFDGEHGAEQRELG